MDADIFELARQFREMADEELVARCGDGTLTEAAQRLALRELRTRGLILPQPAAPAEEEDYEGDFQTVARFLNPTDAHVVRSCLEAAGVPAIVADANLTQMNNLWAIALGGASVRVPAARVAEAKAVIEAFNRGVFALKDDEE